MTDLSTGHVQHTHHSCAWLPATDAKGAECRWRDGAIQRVKKLITGGRKREVGEVGVYSRFACRNYSIIEHAFSGRRSFVPIIRAISVGFFQIFINISSRINPLILNSASNLEVSCLGFDPSIVS